VVAGQEVKTNFRTQMSVNICKDDININKYKSIVTHISDCYLLHNHS
jgi:hypothetical protein